MCNDGYFNIHIVFYPSLSIYKHIFTLYILIDFRSRLGDNLNTAELDCILNWSLKKNIPICLFSGIDSREIQ